MNAQKLVAFLYTNNEATEREIKESIPFTVAHTHTRTHTHTHTHTHKTHKITRNKYNQRGEKSIH